jgi:hypothetical protein
LIASQETEKGISPHFNIVFFEVFGYIKKQFSTAISGLFFSNWRDEFLDDNGLFFFEFILIYSFVVGLFGYPETFIE